MITDKQKNFQIAQISVIMVLMVALYAFIKCVESGQLWRIIFSAIGLAVFIFLETRLLIERSKLSKQN